MRNKKIIVYIALFILLISAFPVMASIPSTVQWGATVNGWHVGVDQANGKVYVEATTSQPAQATFNLYLVSTDSRVASASDTVTLAAGYVWSPSYVMPLGGQVYYTNTNVNYPVKAYSPVYTGPTAPSVPTGLIITSSTSNSAVLSWTPNEGSDSVTSYNFYDNNSLLGSTSATNYAANNLVMGVHSFQISAVNAYGESPKSSAVNFSVSPDAPIISVSNITTSSAYASWPNVTGANSYDIYLNNSFVRNITDSFFSFTNLLDNTNYEIKVIVKGSGTNSQPSTLSFTTVSLPSPPQGLQATNVTTNSVDLSWIAVEGSTNYILDQNNQVLATTPNTFYHATGLSPNSNYTYKVKVVTTDGTSNFSDPISINTLGMPPNSPNGLSVLNLTDTSFTLYWLRSNDVDSYNVYSNGSFVANVPQTLLLNPSYSFTGISPNSAYSLTVIGVNSWGLSGASQALNITTPYIMTLPNKVTNLKLLKAGTTSASISWDSVSNATDYQYMITDVLSTTSSNVQLTNLSPSKSYKVYVRSHNSIGFSDWTSLSFVTSAPSANLNMSPKTMLDTASPVVKPVGGILAFIVAVKVVAIIASHFIL